jgi:riboflavin biosynthesis pyrimidine reductase
VILTRVFPAPGSPISLDAPDARDQLIELYRPPSKQWLRLNLIASVTGSAVGSDGTSETLTNPADRTILGVIRMLADVVLVGAASVRTEGYFMPRKAALAILTSTGNLAGHRITISPDRGPVIVLCPPSAVATVRQTLGDIDVKVIELPHIDGEISAPDIVDALHNEGYFAIVCEGGPRLAAHLVEGGVVDEACFSTSPLINGSESPLFGDADVHPIPLTLSQLVVDNASGIYARWLVGKRSATSE